MGVYLLKKDSLHGENNLIYPENIPINTLEGFRHLGDYLYDCQRLDHGLNAYWKSYMQGNWEALINIGILLLKYGYEEEGRACIRHGYIHSQTSKALYVYIKCILLFNWTQEDFNIAQHIIDIGENPDEDAFDFLVWYYSFADEIDHSITAFLQLENEANQLKWLGHYMKYILGLGKEVSGQAMIKHLKKRYPKVYTKELIKTHLDIKSYSFVVEYTEKNSNYALYQSIAYFHLNQIISSVKAANTIEFNQLDHDERIMAYRHMAKLAEIGADFERETLYLESLLLEWKQHERYIRREMRAHEIRFIHLDQS